MGYLRKFENFTYEAQEIQGQPKIQGQEEGLSKDKIEELHNSFEKTKEIVFKFNKPIGGLQQLTFYKKEGKTLPRLKESKTEIFKAAKTAWNDIKKYINDVIKMVAKQIKLGADKLINLLKKLLGMKDQELEQKLSTSNEGSEWYDYLAGIVFVIGITLAIVAISNYSGVAIGTVAGLKYVITALSSSSIIFQIGAILMGTSILSGIGIGVTRAVSGPHSTF